MRRLPLDTQDLSTPKTGQYVPRLLEPLIRTLLVQLPALMITGPRATGKTTTAERHAATVIHLDRAQEGDVFRADADAALSRLSEPVLLDEWQAVPEILGAVKRTVDRDPSPGRYLLTGSVRADMTGATWPGTGRVVRLSMYGLTRRELSGGPTESPFLTRLSMNSLDVFQAQDAAPNIVDYVRMAIAGGFPEAAVRLDPDTAARWLAGYVDNLITRDVPEVGNVRDPARLRRYLHVLALNTAGTPTASTLYDAAGVDARTAAAYDRLLSNLFIADCVPAWTERRLPRLTHTPKRLLVDPSLMGPILDLDEAAFFTDANILGRLIETFVVAQIRPELELSSVPPRLYHLRDQRGREIDMVAEQSGNRLTAIEVKAKGTVSLDDAKHLLWLRDQVGARFLAGAVLHTGPMPFRLADRILALPISAIWN